MSATPGPWTLEMSTAFAGYAVGPDGEIVAIAVESDARLIAAAPELLAALRDIERDAQSVIDSFEGTLEAPHAVYVLRDTARAAIAQATGTEVEA